MASSSGSASRPPRVYEAELHRLASELIAIDSRAGTDAEGQFAEALRIARQQDAVSLDTPDVREATTLLEKPAS
jgi:hypothetical protein